MRRISAFSLATGFAMAISVSNPLLGSTLYQWMTKDGTPTYSPDPPPAGIEYQLVGADLKPLAKNVDLTKPTTANPMPRKKTTVTAPPTQAAATPPIKTAPTPLKKPSAPWKPVRYANDPKPAISPDTTKAVEPDPVAIARRSPECNRAKQQMVLLESQFSKAITDEQMDQAILRLKEQKITLKSACKIN